MSRWPEYEVPTEKACTKCKVVQPLVEGFHRDKQKRDGHTSACKTCCIKEHSAHYYKDPSKFSKYRRAYSQRPDRIEARRAADARRYPDHAHKVRARMLVHHAVKAGKIEKLPCKTCGNPDSQGHHHDYAKPLDVEWLCRACHAAEHRVERGTPATGMRR